MEMTGRIGKKHGTEIYNNEHVFIEGPDQVFLEVITNTGNISHYRGAVASNFHKPIRTLKTYLLFAAGHRQCTAMTVSYYRCAEVFVSFQSVDL